MKILKEMQRRLDTSVNFVTPTGELIKEGKIKAISSQTNKKADRYMFLVSTLICQIKWNVSDSHRTISQI